MASIELRSVRKSFGRQEVIHGIDLAISAGEFVALVGPSGCGKSTLLRIIAGLDELSSGEILIDGETAQDFPPAKRGLAMVFQNYSLYPHMTVAENMEFSLRMARVSKAVRETKVRAVAKLLGVEMLLDRKPRELSGGQSQRVAIGRAMVRQPKAFLFDEPLSNLDAALRAQMRLELVRLHSELKATMVYVTHDQVEAMTMADRVVVLNEGRVEQIGSPLELYQNPASMFVAGFLGAPRMNLLSGTVEAGRGGAAALKLAGGTLISLPCQFAMGTSGQQITVGIRPEHITLEANGQVRGTVVMIEQLGARTNLHLKLATGDMFVVQIAGNLHFQQGEEVRAHVAPERCHFFDGQGERVDLRDSRKVTVAVHASPAAAQP